MGTGTRQDDSTGRSERRPASTGIAGLDAILHGGLPRGEMYLLQGATAPARPRSRCNTSLLEPGNVYVCRPGTHMTAEHCIRLVEGPKLDFVRPSADLMFQSVARSYRDRAIGVVLSGSGSDGAVGCLAISEAGGTVIGQDPATSRSKRFAGHRSASLCPTLQP